MPAPERTFTLMVTGGRAFKDAPFIAGVLDRLAAEHAPTHFIHGGAVGVDSIAGEWAERRGLVVRNFPPDHKLYGHKAPLKRNLVMLAQKPDLLVVFPGGSSTAYTKRHAVQQGLNVVLATSV